MWVDRTQEEIEKVRQQRLYQDIGVASFVWIISTILIAAFPKRKELGGMIDPIAMDEIARRIPVAMGIGIGIALIYLYYRRQRQTLICPKCDSTKFSDGHGTCSCGGQFRPLDEMKWIEPSEKNTS